MILLGIERMKASVLVIRAVWLFVVVSATVGGYDLPGSEIGRTWELTDAWSALGQIVLLPLLVFLMSFRRAYAPGWPPAIVAFSVRLRMELLMGTYGVLFGAIGLIRNIQLDAPEGAFVIGGFYFSGGIAFWASWVILSSRGVLPRLQPMAYTPPKPKAF